MRIETIQPSHQLEPVKQKTLCPVSVTALKSLAYFVALASAPLCVMASKDVKKESRDPYGFDILTFIFAIYFCAEFIQRRPQQQ